MNKNEKTEPQKKVITKEEAEARKQQIDGAPNVDDIKNAEIPTRRVRMLMVNPTDFMYLFTKGLEFRKRTKISEGVPEDAKLIAVAADSVRNGIMLVVESDSYEPIPINVLPPVQPISIQTGDPDATKKKKSERKKKK